MSEQEAELEAFLLRLNNWRRVFSDRTNSYKSPTLVFIEYAKAHMQRKRETDSQKYWREMEELKAIDDALPPPDVQDANLLNEVWSSMPDLYEQVPVKKVIKTYTFGSWREFEQLRYRLGIHRSEEKAWVQSCIRLFFVRVRREEHLGFF